MKQIKKGDILLAIAILALSGIFFFQKTTPALGLSSSQSLVHYEIPIPPAKPLQGFLNNSFATTSLTYLVAGGASTTLPAFDTSPADVVDLDIQLVASSSATTLHWVNEFSFNGIDWFGESTKNVLSGASTIYTASTTNSWTPAFAGRGNTTVSTSTINVQIPSVATPFARVNFSVSGANGAVWVTAVTRIPNRR